MGDLKTIRIDAGCILTMNDAQPLLYDHSVVMSGSTIRDLLPTTEASAAKTDQVFDLKQHAIMPGLINAHGHAAMSLLRGIANDLPLQEWLEQHIWPAEGANVSEDFVRLGTRLAIAEMLKSGTTTFSDMYFFPEAAASEVDEQGIRAQLCTPILDFPTPWGSGPDEYLSKSKALHERFRNHQRISIALGPHAPYTVSNDALKNVCHLAVERDMAIQMHVHETQQEVDDAIALNGKRPIERLADLGLLELGSAVQAVHMTALTADEVALMAAKNVHVVHCPESNMKLASGFCPTQDLLSAGVNVALGTDGAASNNDLDMFGEMRTAALIAKGYSGNAAAVPAREALKMATINGAKALRLEHKTGSIEIGKQADLIALNLSQLNTVPSYDIEADIVYNVNSRQVSHAWVAGELLLDCGRLTRVNEEELIAQSKLRQKSVLSSKQR
jgi:5-methylthioadenosine/S-adenosylhomocysteine deaminase